MDVRNSRLLLAAATAVLGVSACGGGPADSRPPEARAGHLVVEQVARRRTRLLDAPARATFCAGDSVLVVIAVDETWAAGLALRTIFPVLAVRSLRVATALSGEGTGAAAFRSVADSVRQALLASSGTVRLAAGAQASGTFDITVPAPQGSRGPIRLLGAFRALPTTDTAGACGSALKTP
jgi:hypothetical protein